MKLGLFTPVFGKRSLEEMLTELERFPEVTALELGCGGWPGSSHVDPEALILNPNAAREYRKRLQDAGLSISALSCHGNPLHPNSAIAAKDDEILRRTVTLAELLEVPVVVTFSGCPGGSPADTTPNWITTPWPPEYSESLEWQWEDRLVPYWIRAARAAADSGVKIALEAHPGFCVYNTETLLRLRAATSPSLGINLDPSHLWWQGMDVAVAVAALGESIFHVHAKDVFLNSSVIAVNGVLDAKSYLKMAERSWLFRTVGWGHGESEWKGFISALRLAGYDHAISIEHEDALMSVPEGLSSAISFLSKIILKEPPVEAWWV